MSTDRRVFLKILAGGSAGFLINGTCLANGLLHPFFEDTHKNTTGTDKVVFPFFRYILKYNIGDYLPKDQGGKFIQMELMGTEDDKLIVEKIRKGLLEEVYGNPINWNRLEAGEVEKSVWLNRFYYLPSFARLYRLTGDKSYVTEMMQRITRWIDENPLLPDSQLKTYNWRDMQVAWRSIHLSWCYFLTEKELADEQKLLITNSLKQHAKTLLSGFGQQPLNEFNHQSHGALAMLYLGVLFPWFEQADELRQSAIKILSHHLENAFYSDGGNVEEMFGYYPFETHIFRDTYLLCSHNNLDFPPQLLPMLQKMAQFLSAVVQPDGTMPQVNDSYEMPAEPTLTTVNEILANSISIQSSSGYFPETQIGIMRGTSTKNSWYVLAYPAKIIGSHTHAGRLAFTFWLNGEAILVDSGCTNYDNPKLVSWYRTSRAHNTVLVDGKSDAATSTNNLWVPKRVTGNRITHWEEKSAYVFCRMVSPGTEAINNSVTWSRSLALIKNEFLVVHDCFISASEHNYEILFHFPPVKLIEKEKKRAILALERSSLAIIPADHNMMENLAVAEGLVSIKGEGTPSPVATYQFKGKGVMHSVIVFMPLVEDVAQVKIRQVNTVDGVGVTISKANLGKTVLLMRNNESEELSVLGHKTRRLFEVF